MTIKYVFSMFLLSSMIAQASHSGSPQESKKNLTTNADQQIQEAGRKAAREFVNNSLSNISKVSCARTKAVVKV